MIRYARLDPVERISPGYQVPNNLPSIILIVAVTLFIGLRPLSGAFVDMMNYNESYTLLYYNESSFEYNPDSTNFLFSNLFKFLAVNSYEIIVFFFIIACIYFGCLYWGLAKIFPNDLFYALIIYLGAFSTFSYGTNGIKAGAAASIFILVFAYYRKPLIAAFFCFISLGFHHAMVVPIIAFAMSYFIKNPKWYFWGWIFCLIMAVLHISYFQELFAGFADEGGQNYLTADEDDWGGRAGFRWDFILYVIPTVAIGWWTTYVWRRTDRLYQLLLCTFLTTNAVWMLCMYMPFNNRLAYLSWFILPVLIAYPFFKYKIAQNQYRFLNYVVGIYLAFSIASTFFL